MIWRTWTETKKDSIYSPDRFQRQIDKAKLRFIKYIPLLQHLFTLHEQFKSANKTSFLDIVIFFPSLKIRNPDYRPKSSNPNANNSLTATKSAHALRERRFGWIEFAGGGLNSLPAPPVQVDITDVLSGTPQKDANSTTNSSRSHEQQHGGSEHSDGVS